MAKYKDKGSNKQGKATKPKPKPKPAPKQEPQVGPKGLTAAQVDQLSVALRMALVPPEPAPGPAGAEKEALRLTLANTLLQLFLSVARKGQLENAQAVIQSILDGGGQGGGNASGGPEDPEAPPSGE